jgi:phosphohistidine phosphatase
VKILLIRHGEAIDPRGTSDAWRYLTAHGRATTRRAAEALVQRGHAPTHLYTSPLVRAVQTAEILAATLQYDGEVVADPRLAPGFDAAKLASVLDESQSEREIAFVGHEPDLGGILTLLLSLPKGYAMRKGAIAALDLPNVGEPVRVDLAWLLTGDRRIEDPADLLA